MSEPIVVLLDDGRELVFQLAGFESDAAFMASVQAEYDRVLGPGVIQVVADSESPVEDAVNGDARSND